MAEIFARDLLLRAARELKEAGVPDPEYDSSAMLSHLTGEPPMALRVGFSTVISEQEAAAFAQMMARRKKREPLQYILEETNFGVYAYTVRPGALIPRPETQELSEWASSWLSEWIYQRMPDPPRPEVLDLCCGSGCLGISLKMNLPHVRCTLADLSPEALAVARGNVMDFGLECEILEGDLFQPVKDRKFDLIVSNPPYIPSGECDTLQPEVLFEPRMALDGGTDGLDFYRRIAREAPEHLNPGGALMMEMGIQEAAQVRSMLEKHGAKRTEIRKDFAGIDRMILAEYE